ncbi:MAG: 3-dehydroquinate synthase [Candidatus Hydrogenedens sp.]|nr:3-dehydroquinate synthase [Candidatus Hydrogenedens sp.]
MKTVTVQLGERAYPIHIGEDALQQLPGLIEASGQRGAVGIVTDSNVGPLYAAQVEALAAGTGRRVITHAFQAGEDQKRLARVEEICGTFLEAGLDRASLFIALGGGVVGDVAGYAAASFMRGVPFIQIPTTIIAQVDSSVGGKTGVNHPLGKNTIGAFHQPNGVLIDLRMLGSLPDRELRAGLSEAIKHGIIADEALFAYMESNAAAILSGDRAALVYPVERSCEIKAAVVAEDEHEHGARANLNYGHTFGHAIEAVTAYKKFLHGEAISLGMCAAGHLSEALGMVGPDFVARQRACFEAYGLPVVWPELPVEETLAAMTKDKKARAGTLKFIVAARMGEVVQRTDIAPESVRAALEAIRG